MSSLKLLDHQKTKYSFLQVAKRRVLEFDSYLKAITNSQVLVEKKFVIYGQGRTGSELLCYLLDSIPEIRCDTEIFYRHVFFPKLFVRGKCASSTNKVYGFKVKPYQLIDEQRLEIKAFLEFLLSENYQVIYLKRKNLLRHSLSLLIARERKRFHIPKNCRIPQGKINIDLNSLLANMEDREKYQKGDEDILNEITHLTIVYEDDLLKETEHQSTVDKICNYLGTESAQVSPKFQRLTPDKLDDIIENYKELVDFISKTKYFEFLNDDG